MHALRAETASADAELATGAASAELQRQRQLLESEKLKMASMKRMFESQLSASQAAQEAEKRLRAELLHARTEQQLNAAEAQRAMLQRARERAELPNMELEHMGAQEGGKAPGDSVVLGAVPGSAPGGAQHDASSSPLRSTAGSAPNTARGEGHRVWERESAAAEAKVAEEVASLRAQLRSISAKSVEQLAELQTRLSAESGERQRLRGAYEQSEAELRELTEAYSLVWDELQQQRGALQAATAQLEAMKLHVESKHTNVDIILTPRGSSSDSSTGSNTSLRTSVGYPTQSTR